MDFRAEVAALVRQIPEGRVARCVDIARALGDVRASAAVYRFLRQHPDLPGADRVATTPTNASDAHPFDAFRTHTPLAEFRAEQVAIAARVSRRNGFRPLRTVAGVDISYDGDRGFVSLVVLDARTMAVIEEVYASRDVDFPYIPTYLAYREFPLIESAMARLSRRPTVLLVDGHGQLHPVRCGIACLVGVRLNVPTIGVAKSPLFGTVSYPPKIGEAAPVRVDGETLGYAVRTSSSAKPLFVSTGHRVAPRTAVRIVRGLCRARNPEPLRLAHAHATEWKRRQRKMF